MRSTMRVPGAKIKRARDRPKFPARRHWHGSSNFTGMNPRPKKPLGVVITGASSGNGRAGAIEFARTGATVVLAARNAPVLREVARECQRYGGRAIVVPTDVSDYAQVERLARRAIRELGRVDVWINNAGVGAVGRFHEVPIASHRQVVETNLLGVIHGCHAILPHFLEQKRGVIINTNSVGAWVPMPYSCAYSASKFGMRGFCDALRAELSGEPDIHVCEIHPAFVRTPAIHHAANYVGRKVGNPPLAGDPWRVGRMMVRLARRPRERQSMMILTRVARLGYFLFPHLVRWATARAFTIFFRLRPEVATGDGNLFRPASARFGVTSSAPVRSFFAPEAPASKRPARRQRNRGLARDKHLQRVVRWKSSNRRKSDEQSARH